MIDYTAQSGGNSPCNIRNSRHASVASNSFHLGTRQQRMALAVSFALLAPAAYAGPGSVCNDNPLAPVAPAAASCVNRIGTYYANSPKLRKFVDTLPGLTPAGASTFASGGKAGEYIPLATADTTTYPGSNYFVIAVVEHQQWMHSDLQKATTQRSYVQVYPQGYTGLQAATATPLTYPNGTTITWPGTSEQVVGYDKPHYLGPIILTTTGTPVRVKMVNFLPTGAATLDVNGRVIARNGDMFLPVDETLPGAGVTTIRDKFPQNRVGFHLHGGDSPWISDGTPHQWIAAVGDTTPHKKGDRLTNVPDMPDPGDGAQTIFWPNDQSSRLMWYHDHTFGLTRQNAYSGAAAGYVIMDAAEMALLNGGTLNGETIKKAIPGALLEQLVLVVQDKGFVPDDIAIQDANWDTIAWGKPGDLWYPHVYEPNQMWNMAAGTLSATNPAGRWDYAIDKNSFAFLPARYPLPDNGFGTASATPESYMDTPMVNGVAYPVLNVAPKAYRVRFLNGANDRYFNLSLWVADGTTKSADGRTHTEIKTVAGDGRPGGIPDPMTAGPNIIQFANEAGLLPHPVVHRPAPMTGVYDPLAGFVETKGDFYLGGAERADTVIDFSQYAGKTLIMYNDSSAPVPAGDPRYDYFTGDEDQSAAGGAPPTLAGFGPNTRTVMQIIVANTAPAAAYDRRGTGGAMATELPKAYAAVADPHIVPAIDVTRQLQVDTVAHTMTYPVGEGKTVTVPLHVRTIEGFDDANFGRLDAQIGTELHGANQAATPLAYIDMPNDIINAGETQYWIIKNNDGDNHPMHFHLFNVQVVARMSQTVPAEFSAPEPDEAGWKETVKNWPGEDVIIALKPKTPALPFGLPNSVRLLDPTLVPNATTNDAIVPAGALDAPPLAFTQVDLNTGLAANVSNTLVDYGWEYVWHCHILGHEENDLMRPMVFHPVLAVSAAPNSVAVSANGLVTWTDPTPVAALSTKGNPANEIGFRVERALVTNGVIGTFAPIAATGNFVVSTVNTLANATSVQDAPAADTSYQYRVFAVNQSGETLSKPAPLAPTLAAPGGLTATVAGTTSPSISLAWTDNASTETGYVVQRSTANIGKGSGNVTWSNTTALPKSTSVLAANLTSYVDAGQRVAADTLYQYQVGAVQAAFAGPTAIVNVATATALLPPTQLQAGGAAGTSSLPLSFQQTTSRLATGYEVQHCIGSVATCAIAPSTAWQPTPGDMVVGANSNNYNTKVLTTKTTYSFRVRAVNSVIPTLVSPWAGLFAMTTL
jgi:FtsP/CotA-like multicopper oxidase with cupredoxin domain